MSFIANSSKIDRHKGKCFTLVTELWWEENSKRLYYVETVLFNICALNIGRGLLCLCCFVCSFCFINWDAGNMGGLDVQGDKFIDVQMQQ